MLLPEQHRSRRSRLTAVSAHGSIPIVALRHVLNLIQCHVLNPIQYRLRADPAVRNGLISWSEGLERKGGATMRVCPVLPCFDAIAAPRRPTPQFTFRTPASQRAAALCGNNDALRY